MELGPDTELEPSELPDLQDGEDLNGDSLWAERSGGGAGRAGLSTVDLTSQLADSFYNEEQRGIMETVQRLCEEEINPHRKQWDQGAEK